MGNIALLFETIGTMTLGVVLIITIPLTILTTIGVVHRDSREFITRQCEIIVSLIRRRPKGEVNGDVQKW